MPFTLTMPKLSPTMTEGTIVKWCKREGEYVKAGELLIQVATDKATIEYEALDAGWLRKILIKEGEEASVNQPVAIFTEEETEEIEKYQPEEEVVEEAPVPVEEKPLAKEEEPISQTAMMQPSYAPEPPLEEYSFQFPAETPEGRLRASPLARRLAKERGLDLSTVKGSGPRGRVIAKDLEQAQPGGIVHREIPRTMPGTFEETRLTPLRKIVSKRLQETKTFVPHFYLAMDIDARALFDLHKQLKKQSIKVTYNDFVVRASALALRKHPVINSSFHTEAQSIVNYKTIDISVAVSVEGGLITPIIRHADYKSLGQLSAEIKALVKRARDQKLEPQEYRGGSFTVSNLGMYGIAEFFAIINPPQGAILAVGGIKEVPIIEEGKIVPGKEMRCALSVDHRVIDGVAAAEFLQTLKEFLEGPAVLLL